MFQVFLLDDEAANLLKVPAFILQLVQELLRQLMKCIKRYWI